MFKTREIKLFKIFNVEIAADYSWFWIYFLIAWSFGQSLAIFLPNQNLSTYIFFGLVSSVLFFASVIMHELAHALVARVNGMPINKITLFLFGGAANLTKEPDSALIELKMAAAGPILSILLGVVLLTVSSLLESERATIIIFLLQSLGVVNIILATFNLLPGFPLDGGRILRALIWLRIKNFLKATYYASMSGKVIAVILGIGGLAQILILGTFGGFWLILIAFFLYQAANASYNYSKVISNLNKHLAKNFVISENDIRLQTTYILGDVLDKILQSGKKYLPVYKSNDIVGVISTDNLKDVGSADWSEVELGMIMTPLEYLPEIQADQKASAILQCFEEKETDILKIYDKKKFLGLVTLEEISKRLLD